MADIVKFRASVFIGGMAWLPPAHDPASGNRLEFAADIRGFTPHAVNTGRSRVEQEVVVDFAKRRLVSFGATGVTVLKMTGSDGTVTYRQGHASTEGIVMENEVWGGSEVTFTMRASVSNPLRPGAPSPDYALRIKAKEDGTAHISGSHDGFPCYEFYKQVDFGEFQPIYLHHFLDTGDTPAAMAGEMEYHFEKHV
ncbi:hypothetical protein SK3146_05853 [Paenibacillus konkukensis]|uniref:Permease n=1 Tax=Paenibacillus konkukensis TaxID=2020716 RepID=A0ABY4RXI8_9BACL|nr:DUF3238 domain-containing protein [Paenibacillus konkukensis]UQZ86560.1 hypothetical protein SK3146_05853 [Paenibacillus konkukensis]